MVTDPETVRATYSKSLKAWLGDLGDGKHDGGPDDPRIGVIRVKTRTATYAVAIGTVLGRGAEIVKGALTGQAPNVNKLRELNEDELNQCMSCYFIFLFASIHQRLDRWHQPGLKSLDGVALFFYFWVILTTIQADPSHRASIAHKIDSPQSS